MVQLTSGSYIVLDCSDWYDLMYLPERRKREDNGTGQLSFQLGQKLENRGAPFCHNYLLCRDHLISLLLQNTVELQMAFLMLLFFSIKLSILKTVTRKEVTKFTNFCKVWNTNIQTGPTAPTQNV